MTVELLGLLRTEPTARRSVALRSLSNFVCCASLRSSGDNEWLELSPLGNEVTTGRTLLNDRRECALFRVPFCQPVTQEFLPGWFGHRVLVQDLLQYTDSGDVLILAARQS